VIGELYRLRSRGCCSIVRECLADDDRREQVLSLSVRQILMLSKVKFRLGNTWRGTINGHAIKQGYCLIEETRIVSCLSQ
jgi:hypothetical protein